MGNSQSPCQRADHGSSAIRRVGAAGSPQSGASCPQGEEGRPVRRHARPAATDRHRPADREATCGTD